MIVAGNRQVKVAVDVLLEDDLVDGGESGTPLLQGARSLRRRLLEFEKWSVVQLQLGSWFLVRHNNVEKKKFLFRADRLRSYAGITWCNEGAVANLLEGVDNCLSLLVFLEKVLCTHPKGLQALDSPMVTSCFRKMALQTDSSPQQKKAPSAGGARTHSSALQNADPKTKKRVEDLLSNSGLQTRALELVEQLSFSDSAGVLVCIAQVWVSVGSPHGALHQPLLIALCDKIAKELVPPEMSSSAAERLALALLELALPPSGESELPLSALKAAVGAALTRCRETSSASSATGSGGRFLMSLDPQAATALAKAAALLVPLPTHYTQTAGSTGAKRRDGGLFAVEEVWGIEADNWQKQPLGPDESLTSQVTALATRLSSLVSSRSLSAVQVVHLVRAFARGTPRDTSLFRALLAQLSEFAADTAVASDASGAAVAALENDGASVAAASSRAGTGLAASDLLELVTSCARHGLRIDVLPLAILQRLQDERFLADVSFDEVLSLLWSMAWGIFWDAALWVALVRCLHHRGAHYESAECRALGKHVENASMSKMGDGGEDVVLQVRRDVMLLWAVSAVRIVLWVCGGLSMNRDVLRLLMGVSSGA